MSSIFIYYSDTGSGDAVAECLAGKGFAIRKAEPVKPMPSSFFLKILKGGFQAGIGSEAKLRDYDPDVSGFDEVVVGSPIWNGRITPQINTVLSETDLSGKKLSFVLYSGGGDAPKAEKKLKESYPGCTVINLKSPKQNPGELEKLVF